MVSAVKDPAKVRAGQASAIARWGPEPRIVRIDDLTPPQRRLVLALIDTVRKEAVPESQKSGTAEEARRADDDPPTAG